MHPVSDRLRAHYEATFAEHGATNGYWMPTIVCAPDAEITRERLLAAFKEKNFDARVLFHPLSSPSMFEPRRENRHACDIPARAINLPSWHDMGEGELGTVEKIVRDLMADRQDR